MRIFGVDIDDSSRRNVLDAARGFMVDREFHQIVTVNPEFLLLARTNKRFKAVLQQCDMCVPDGFGVTLAHWFCGRRAPERYPGADLMVDLLKFAHERKLSVFLACRADGLSSYDEVRSVIFQKFPNIQTSGANIQIENFSVASHSKKLLLPHGRLLLCNFGAPYQEFFLSSLENRGDAGLAIGVGGSFDYLTGKQKRAPKIFRSLGVEWLWRLAIQPRRCKRIFRAVIVFPVLVLLSTLKRREEA